MSTAAHLPTRPIFVGPLAYAPRHDGESRMTGDGDGGEDAAGHLDLASRALGGSVLVANDETYAEKENLIKVAAPTFTPATMGPRGQVYDGWETRRRLTIHPDGGVARLRVLGEVVPDPRRWAGLTVDLATADNGGTVLDASDRFFSPPENAIRPGHAVTMSDGWETRRRRGGGCDWLLLHLGAPGQIRQFYVDTMHFVGNSPGAIRLTAVDSADPDTADVPAEEWPELLPRTGIQPDTRHWFGRDAGLDTERTVDRVRVELIPDGGLSRLRLWGVPSDSGRAAAGLRWWNLLPVRDAARQVRSCCSAPAWATALADERPADDLDALCAASERITLARIGQAPTGKGREAQPAARGDHEPAAAAAVV
jgi:allantoicase